MNARFASPTAKAMGHPDAATAKAMGCPDESSIAPIPIRDKSSAVILRLTCIAIAAVAAWVSAAGCGRPLGGRQQFATQSDRLMAHYPDLRTGRFAVLADFEQMRHLELFQLDNQSQKGEQGLLLSGGVPETGGRCLRVVLGSSSDSISAINSQAKNWFLKRDWRDYTLLLMNVHSASDDVMLELTIVGGSARAPTPVHTRVPLHAGWNTVRLDLYEVGETIPLDSIREVRWSVIETDRPTELRLDDIILADNREEIMGSSTGDHGRLYVQRVGRRWRIGAAGRFELGFANGQIVEWYHLESDPNRLRNLLAGTVLGPLPIVLPDSVDEVDVTDFSDLGDAVLARQRVIEASDLRVIVACDWEFTGMPETPPDAAPFHRWTYTIYSTGQIFVHVETTTSSGSWQVDDVGLALTRAGGSELEVFPHSAAQLDAISDLRHTCYGYTQPSMLDGPSLLWVMHDGRVAPRMEALQEPGHQRAIMVTSGGITERPVQSWDCLISIWPADQVLDSGAENRALDYCYPAQIDPSVGRRVIDHPDDAGHDGYAEQTGSYLMTLEDGRLRFVIAGSRRTRHDPVFTLLDSADRQAVVYVDYVLLDTQARDAAGNVIFQIPRTIDKDTLVEVYYLQDTPE